MTGRPRARLAHLGLFVWDLERMSRFYRQYFDMVETDRGTGSSGAAGVFLSADESEHHQLVLAVGRAPDSKSTLNQLSFLVDSLEAVQDFWRRFSEDGVPVRHCKNHGNAWSVYVHDPEENTVEVYCHSPWYVSQPLGEPLDLSLPADQIRSQTEALVRGMSSFATREEWQCALSGKLAGEPQ